jgi:hypothetical protein
VSRDKQKVIALRDTKNHTTPKKRDVHSTRGLLKPVGYNLYSSTPVSIPVYLRRARVRYDLKKKTVQPRPSYPSTRCIRARLTRRPPRVYPARTRSTRRQITTLNSRNMLKDCYRYLTNCSMYAVKKTSSQYHHHSSYQLST